MAQSEGDPRPLPWIAIVRALRHRTLNRLQIALGWAQLGEAAQVEAAILAHVQEEVLISALLRSSGDPEQRAFLRLLAQAERRALPVTFEGSPQNVPDGVLGRIVPALRAALSQQGGSGLRVLCDEGEVRPVEE